MVETSVVPIRSGSTVLSALGSKSWNGDEEQRRTKPEVLALA